MIDQDKLRAIQFDILKFLMVPIARFCIRHSHSFQDLMKAAKIAFINVAEDEIRNSNEKITMSRLSVISGIHRSEITRIAREKDPILPEGAKIVARVIAEWRHDPKYRTKSGEPRVLSCEGEDNEFYELVRHVNKSLNPYTVLLELLRANTVERGKKGLKLLREMQGFEFDPREGFKLLAQDIDTQIMTVEENLLNRESITNLHMRTEYDNVAKKFLPEIRNWFLAEGKVFHRRAREFLSQYDKDMNEELRSDPSPGVRVTLSAFSHTPRFE